MIKKYINSLKQGSDNKANSFALIASLVVMVFVFGAWYLTLGPKLDSIAAKSQGKETPGIFSGVKDNVASAIDGFNSIKDNLSSTKDVVDQASNKDIPEVEIESIR